MELSPCKHDEYPCCIVYRHCKQETETDSSQVVIGMFQYTIAIVSS